uniref:Putative cytochrome c oxidase polypeptide viii n=1 Tax=Ornithodoros turicata TaxID=34597 RepID=A0A2R5LDL3_9ACAR
MNTALQRACTVFRNTRMQVRHRSLSRHQATAPQVRIPTAEKLFHFAAITAGIVAIPAWVFVHLDNYKHHD